MFDSHGNMVEAVKHNDFSFGKPQPHSHDANTLKRLQRTIGFDKRNATQLHMKDVFRVNSYAMLKVLPTTQQESHHSDGKLLLRLTTFALNKWKQAGGAKTMFYNPWTENLFAEDEEDEAGYTLIHTKIPRFQRHNAVVHTNLMMSEDEMAFS